MGNGTDADTEFFLVDPPNERGVKTVCRLDGLAYLTEKCGVNCLRNTQVLNGWQVPGPR